MEVQRTPMGENVPKGCSSLVNEGYGICSGMTFTMP